MRTRKTMKASKAWTRESVRRGRQERGFWRCEVRGAEPGPVLAVIAGQHGMEPAGPAMLAELLNELDPGQMRGTLYAVPMAYETALRSGYECEVTPAVSNKAMKDGIPWGGCPWRLSRQTCGRNYNRLWPGKKNGSMSDRVIARMWDTVVAPAEYVIDYHCWTDLGPPGILFYDDKGMAFGRQFGIPWVQMYPSTDHPGILSLYASRQGKTAFCAELTPQRRVSKAGVDVGRQGILNIMRHLRMIPGKPPKLPPQYLFEWKPGDQRNIKAPFESIVIPASDPGRFYRKGEVVGTAVRLDDPRNVRKLKAPCDGLGLGDLKWAVAAKGATALPFMRVRPLPPVKS